MAVNDGQTDRTKAIIIKNIPHRTLRELDEEVGELLTKTRSNFDVTLIFRGLLRPILRFSYERRENKTND